MAIDLEKKSNRLLGNRRFTSADLNTSQEAFTDVLDIGADEIYTQTHLIPSSNLPFSGSTQSGQTSGVLKYYCRQRLTRSNVGYGTLLSFVYLIFIIILMTILIRFVNRWLQRAS